MGVVDSILAALGLGSEDDGPSASLSTSGPSAITVAEDSEHDLDDDDAWGDPPANDPSASAGPDAECADAPAHSEPKRGAVAAADGETPGHESEDELEPA